MSSQIRHNSFCISDMSEWIGLEVNQLIAAFGDNALDKILSLWMLELQFAVYHCYQPMKLEIFNNVLCVSFVKAIPYHRKYKEGDGPFIEKWMKEINTQYGFLAFQLKEPITFFFKGIVCLFTLEHTCTFVCPDFRIPLLLDLVAVWTCYWNIFLTNRFRDFSLFLYM